MTEQPKLVHDVGVKPHVMFPMGKSQDHDFPLTEEHQTKLDVVVKAEPVQVGLDVGKIEDLVKRQLIPKNAVPHVEALIAEVRRLRKQLEK